MKNNNNPVQNRYMQYIALAAIAPLCIWLIVKSYHLALGSAYHFKAKYYLDLWQKGKPVTELAYNDAKQAAETSLAFDSAQSYYQVTQAKLLEWGRASQFEAQPDDTIADLYSQSINSRPAWPQTYADLAHQQAFFARDIKQALYTLELAHQFGPYTWQVLNQTMMIGLAYWPELTVAQKQQVFKSAEKMSSFNGGKLTKLIETARFYNQQQVLCTYFKFSKQPEDKKRREYLLKKLC